MKNYSNFGYVCNINLLFNSFKSLCPTTYRSQDQKKGKGRKKGKHVWSCLGYPMLLISMVFLLLRLSFTFNLERRNIFELNACSKLLILVTH